MKLTIANDLYQAMVFYLFKNHGLNGRLARVQIVHSLDQDRVNSHDPRAFCCVVSDRPRHILATRYLEALPEAFILGVLYHELGHVALGAFHSSADEAKVDSWCLEFAPELKFTYESATYQGRDGKVLAMNIQKILVKPIEDYATTGKGPGGPEA